MSALSKLPRPCQTDGCPEPVTPPERHCSEHRPRSRTRPSPWSNDKRWQRIRRLALERDGHRCQDCGKDVRLRKGDGNVDHVDGQGLEGSKSYDLENCVTRCRSCHSRKTARHDGGFGHPTRRLSPTSHLEGFDPELD